MKKKGNEEFLPGNSDELFFKLSASEDPSRMM